MPFMVVSLWNIGFNCLELFTGITEEGLNVAQTFGSSGMAAV